MKRLFLVIITAGLLLVPFAAYAGTGSESAAAPPVSQTLVREGDYAIELVGALNIGSVEDETQAEDILAAAGIAPDSGWISDFPVTPDIIAEIQVSIDKAVDAGGLPLGRDDADKAFFAMNADLGLSITPAASSEPANGPAAPAEPAVINNYYYDEGPPVITYYPPPPDYYYLYAWDPFPFWCDGFFFPGFFVLADFHFVFFDRDDFHFHHHHHHDGDHRFITNHVTDPVSKRSVAVDPVTRQPLNRTAFKPVGARKFEPVTRTAGTNNPRTVGNAGGRSFNRTSASNLVNRSVNRTGSGIRNTDRAISRTGSGTWGANRGGGSPSARTDMRWDRTETPSRSGPGAGRSVNRPTGGSDRVYSGRSYNSRSISEAGRSFGGGFSGTRSFSAPRVSNGRSFSAPPSGGRSISEYGRSFGGGFSGGGRSYGGGYSGGGRSFGGGGGRSSGGGGGRSSGGFGGGRGR